MSSFDFSKSFQSIHGNISNIGATLTPFAKRTQRLIQERLGSSDDKTELPEEYLELEQKVDALRTVQQRLLSVTSHYDNEGYDYPPNLREAFVDLSRTIGDKVTTLSEVHSAAEAQAVLTGPGAKKEPKTLNHALGRAALSGVQSLDNGFPLYSEALQKYAVAQEKLGEARLAQDSLIGSKFNAAVTTSLNTSIQFAMKARKNVHDARLNLDICKSAARSARPEKQASLRVEVENAEDEFVAATEEAVSVMKNLLQTPEPLKCLMELITAQTAFHKASSEIMGQLAPQVEKLVLEQETAYRKSRDAV